MWCLLDVHPPTPSSNFQCAKQRLQEFEVHQKGMCYLDATKWIPSGASDAHTGVLTVALCVGMHASCWSSRSAATYARRPLRHLPQSENIPFAFTRRCANMTTVETFQSFHAPTLTHVYIIMCYCSYLVTRDIMYKM